jgi:hypothetical protein
LQKKKKKRSNEGFVVTASSVASLTIITKVRMELSPHLKEKYRFEDLGYKISGATIHVHKSLGPGRLYKALTLLSAEWEIYASPNCEKIY